MLATVAVVAGYLVEPDVIWVTLAVYVVAIAYFGLYSRHHIVQGAPEEEFAALEAAERELK